MILLLQYLLIIIINQRTKLATSEFLEDVDVFLFSDLKYH